MLNNRTIDENKFFFHINIPSILSTLKAEPDFILNNHLLKNVSSLCKWQSFGSQIENILLC